MRRWSIQPDFDAVPLLALMCRPEGFGRTFRVCLVSSEPDRDLIAIIQKHANGERMRFIPSSIIRIGSKTLSPALVLLLLAATLFAVFFRFYHLPQIPPGFTFDEASHALDALDILNGRFFLVSPRLQQTVPGYMVMLAAVFKLSGASPLAQRALTATWGVLLVPLSFLAVLALFKDELGEKANWAAVFSALLISTSFWGVLVSRIGYEYIVPPGLALLAVFFFWRGYQSEQWGLLLAAAICTALNFYLYEGSAPFLLVIPATVLLNRLVSHSASPVRWRAWLFFTLIVAGLALPLFLALTTGATPGVNRTLDRLIFNQGSWTTSLLRLSESLLAHARLFLALGGAETWTYNIPGRPLLDPILALSFVGGIGISLRRARHLPYLFLLVYWAVMLAPDILTFSGAPRYFRMTSALPPTYILIAIAWAESLAWLRCRLTAFLGDRWWSPWLALAPFLLVSLVWLPLNTYQDYFVTWANEPEVAESRQEGMGDLVEYMSCESDPEAVFILPWQAAVSPGAPPDHVPSILEFLYHGQAPLIYSSPDEPNARSALTAQLAGYRTVRLIDLQGSLAGSASLLPLLFEKYGKFVSQEKIGTYNILTYRLDSNQTDFEAHLRTAMPPDFRPLNEVIHRRIKLVGIRYRLDGNTLAVDLAWRPIVRTRSHGVIWVQLLDADGQPVAGANTSLAEDFSTLDAGELALTHHLVPLPGGTRPAAYSLSIRLSVSVNGGARDVGSVILKDEVVIPKRY
jgi:hypothetical protein